MQKKVIALAVAGLVSGVAFAQSNVTIYGVADVGMEVGKYSDRGGVQTRVQSGQSAGSRIGFKGEEALGNGLKALFVMEAGISMDTGNTSHGGMGQTTNYGPMFGRQAFAGIESSTFGAVTFGRQYTTAYNILVKSDAFAYGTGASLGNTLAKIPANDSRWDNAVQYKSPSFAGFSVTGAYSSSATGSTQTGEETVAYKNIASNAKHAGRAMALAGAYENGPIFVGLGYTGLEGATNATQTKAYQLGASYDFKVVKAFASYSAGKTKVDGAADSANANGWSLGAKAPFGNHAVIAQYSKLNDKLAANNDNSIWGLGYEYSLSKRTALYAAYAKGNNKNAAAYSLDGAAAGSSGISTNTQAGYAPWNVMTGVRHTF